MHAQICIQHPAAATAAATAATATAAMATAATATAATATAVAAATAAATTAAAAAAVVTTGEGVGFHMNMAHGSCRRPPRRPPPEAYAEPTQSLREPTRPLK